jgi:hypothetical protein
MAEELRESKCEYKIWKNPSKDCESLSFLGSYAPPEGQFHFTSRDLRDLGFGPGDYTVLAPEGCQHPELFSRWQKVTIPG